MYKILSLDGGGSWAILQLLTLQERFPGKDGHAILKEFDLVIGNSGGSIVMAALTENWSIEKALSLFDNREIRESIFSANRFKERFFPVDYIRLLAPFGPKYSSKRKGEAFDSLFKESSKRQMCDLPEFIGKASLKMVVVTYDALNNRAKFFRSFGEEEQDYDSIKLTQAIHGSSNAPIQYFDFPARFKAKQSGIFYDLWDGALGGFNNPVAAGIIEAMNLGVSKSEMKVYSLGNGNKLMSYEDKEKYYQLKQDSILHRAKKFKLSKMKNQLKFFSSSVLNQAKTILYEPPDWANYVALKLLSDCPHEKAIPNFIRLSPIIHSDRNTLESIRPLVTKLYDLDMDLTDDGDIQLLKDCFEHWKNGEIKNQPIEYKVTRENELLCLSGHSDFQSGLKAWMESD